MRFTLVAAVAALAALGQAQSVCFDDFDCIFAGGKCVRKGASITGTCQKAGVSTVTKSPTKTSAAAGKATGGICFDDGDCIFSGGKCVRKGASITGNCAK